MLMRPMRLIRRRREPQERCMRTLAYASLRGMAILGLGQRIGGNGGRFICVQKRLGVLVRADLLGYASCCLE
jgi:hypothetical protein